LHITAEIQYLVEHIVHILWKVLKNKITSTKCVYKMDGI